MGRVHPQECTVIRYSFVDDNGQMLRFEIDETRPHEPELPPLLPAWARLERHRCAMCSLPTSTEACPAALSIIPVVDAFGVRVSYEETWLEIAQGDVDLRARVQNQDALRSLLGLLLPLSTCPVMRKLRPLARFHQPLADPDHTLFRVLGMHLLAQYLRQREGQSADWSLATLLSLYADIHEVNQRLADRLREASLADANVNSVALLDVLAHAVDFAFDNHLGRLRPLFEDHFDAPA
jgi:hypothetical protein